jgi:hypothetical protein
MERKIPIRVACLYEGGKNWEPVEILGREINSEAVGSLTQANVYGDPSTLLVWKKMDKNCMNLTNEN